MKPPISAWHKNYALHRFKSYRAWWLVSVFFGIFAFAGCNKIEIAPISIFFEQIPGSKNHGPNGTWWGYNQSKIVRFGNAVYMYVVENENIDINSHPNASNPSKMTVYRKEGDGQWQKGAQFNTSRPGNILVTSQGVVHIFVFEPTYTQPSENGSFGRLKHYWFPNSNGGDITTYNQTVIIDNDGVSQGETVNIRLGASVGPNDLLVVSFGLNQTHRVCYFERNGIKWQHEIAGSNLGSDYYYPYVQGTNSGISILAVQNKWVGPNVPSTYQKSHYFEKRNGIWSHENIVDLQSHPLAPTRPQLLENVDIYQDSSGTIHLLYATRLTPENEWQNSFVQVTRAGSAWNQRPVPTTDDKTNWMRMIEVGGQMYYFCAAWDKLYLKKGMEGAFKRIDIPKMKGIYPYLAAPRGGTSISSEFIDILLLCGDNTSYPNAKNYYLRIPKSELSKL